MKQTSIRNPPVTSDDDAPKLTQADFDDAKLRVAGRDVNRAEWQVAVCAQIDDKSLCRAIRQELTH